MSTTFPPVAAAAPAFDDFETLREMLNLAQGGFSLILASFDMPRTRASVQERLRKSFPDSNVVAIDLYEIPSDDPNTRSETVFDQMPALIARASGGRTPDLLFINGLDKLMARDVDRAVQPLNFARNRLKEENPYPVVFWISSRWMPRILEFPDLASWRSGDFRFEGDRQAVLDEAERLSRPRARFWAWIKVLLRSHGSTGSEAQRILDLLPDAEALDSPHTSRLRERLRSLQSRLGKRDASSIARPGYAPLARLTAPDHFFGRDADLSNVVRRVVHVTPRFLVVWGESGCGKSLLLSRGLVPELKQAGVLPVLITGGDQDLIATIEARLSEVNGCDLPLEQAIAKTGATVVLILDQFERFFREVVSAEQRQKVLSRLETLVYGGVSRIRLVIGIRSDELARVLEFGDRIEPLSAVKRFELRRFDKGAAKEVLLRIGESDKAAWAQDEALINAAIDDLAQETRVRPVDVRLMAAALTAGGIGTISDYRRAGGRAVLLEALIERVVGGLSARLDHNSWKRLLLAFIDSPPARLSLTAEGAARRSGLTLPVTQEAVLELESAGLLRGASGKRFELSHDALVGFILAASREIQYWTRTTTQSDLSAPGWTRTAF